MDYYNTEVENVQAFPDRRDNPKESSCAKTGINSAGHRNGVHELQLSPRNIISVMVKSSVSAVSPRNSVTDCSMATSPC